MSYRDRYSRTTGLSGYRSQPVSNRSSLYLSNDYTTSSTTNYNSDLSDFDRQFKKLMERTEKFTSRVEKLQNTSTYIKKGFRRLDNTVTGTFSLILLLTYPISTQPRRRTLFYSFFHY